MQAVRAELKAGQQIIINQLLSTKSARYFVKATNTAKVKQGCAQLLPETLLKDNASDEAVDAGEIIDKKNQEGELISVNECAKDSKEDDVAGASPEEFVNPVDKAKKKLDFDVNGSDNTKQQQPIKLIKCTVKLPDIGPLLSSKVFSLVTNSGASSETEDERTDGEFLLLFPEVKKCSVTLRDVKNHSWWGPKLRKLELEKSYLQEVGVVTKPSSSRKKNPAARLAPKSRRLTRSRVKAEEDNAPIESNADSPEQRNSLDDKSPVVLDESKTEDPTSCAAPAVKSEEESSSQPTNESESTGSAAIVKDECDSQSNSKNTSTAELEQDAVLDLTGLGSNLEAGVYQSVLYFHLDFKRVCSTVHITGDYSLQIFFFMSKFATLMRNVLTLLILFLLR